jgi:hypothetical protein
VISNALRRGAEVPTAAIMRGADRIISNRQSHGRGDTNPARFGSRRPDAAALAVERDAVRANVRHLESPVIPGLAALPLGAHGRKRRNGNSMPQVTNAFSKKLQNHAAAIGLQFMHYNFARLHQTIRATDSTNIR